MTAVLAAIARAVLGAVLLLAAVAAVLWAQYGPQGWPLVAWLVAVCAVVVAAGLCASALQPENERGGEPVNLNARGCARCLRVLVDEDDRGWFYQVPVTDPRMPGLTFMDRVHECDGRPHEVISRLRLAELVGTDG